MEAKIIEKSKDKNEVILSLKGIPPGIANLVRRYILDEVPTIAIEDIEFRKNSSILFDEIIANRLGLVVFKSDIKTYNKRESCKCGGKGCARCEVKVTLSAKGPGMVTAADIKSKDPEIKPVFPETPIVKLLKGQEIELEATATMGSGNINVKWSPAHVWYKYRTTAEFKAKGNADEYAKKFPFDIFDIKGKAVTVNNDKLIRCHACNPSCNDENIIFSEDKDEIIMYIEGFGQLTIKEMISKACDIFDEKMEELKELIKKSSDISI